jgi:hypothetical protein
MTFVRLSDLPEDVREHLVLLEHEADEFPDGCTPFRVPDEDYGFPAQER